MVRISNWLTRHARHKRLLERAKWFRLWRSNVYTQARRALVKQGQNAYIGRKLKKRQFRQLWIERLNATIREKGSSYARFMGAITSKNIILNRKMLSNIALAFPDVFAAMYDQIVH
jgi:large subunit ribosomal protein L20